MNTPREEGMRGFLEFGNEKGYDMAYAYDTERSRWFFWNPMTADLWQCWQAATQMERERAAQEAEHWQQIGRPEHKCGEYIAAAIRSIGKSQSNGRS